MNTTLEQLCEAIYTSAGVLRYQIHSAIIEVHNPGPLGDLPFADIFVMKMLAPNEPKSDVFQRIATVVDLNTLTVGRDAALAKNEGTYLASIFLVDYADVATATKAKLLIQARVDRLIADWIAYNTQFIVPVDTEFPLTDPDILTMLVDVYKAAKKSKTESDATVTSATATKVAADAAVGTTTAAVVTAQALCDECAGNRAAITNIEDAENTFYGASNIFRNYVFNYNIIAAHAGLASALVAYDAELNQVNRDGELALADFSSAIGTQCGTKVTTLEEAQAAKLSADKAAAEATTAQTLAIAEAAAAQTAVDAALTAVLTACPTFDTASI